MEEEPQSVTTSGGDSTPSGVEKVESARKSAVKEEEQVEDKVESARKRAVKEEEQVEDKSECATLNPGGLGSVEQGIESAAVDESLDESQSCFGEEEKSAKQEEMEKEGSSPPTPQTPRTPRGQGDNEDEVSITSSVSTYVPLPVSSKSKDSMRKMEPSTISTEEDKDGQGSQRIPHSASARDSPKPATTSTLKQEECGMPSSPSSHGQTNTTTSDTYPVPPIPEISSGPRWEETSSPHSPSRTAGRYIDHVSSPSRSANARSSDHHSRTRDSPSPKPLTHYSSPSDVLKRFSNKWERERKESDSGREEASYGAYPADHHQNTISGERSKVDSHIKSFSKSDDVVQLQKVIIELQQDNTELRNQLHSAEITMQGQISDLRHALESSQSHCETLSKENTELRKTSENDRLKIARLEDRLRSLESALGGGQGHADSVGSNGAAAWNRPIGNGHDGHHSFLMQDTTLQETEPRSTYFSSYQPLARKDPPKMTASTSFTKPASDTILSPSEGSGMRSEYGRRLMEDKKEEGSLYTKTTKYSVAGHVMEDKLPSKYRASPVPHESRTAGKINFMDRPSSADGYKPRIPPTYTDATQNGAHPSPPGWLSPRGDNAAPYEDRDGSYRSNDGIVSSPTHKNPMEDWQPPRVHPMIEKMAQKRKRNLTTELSSDFRREREEGDRETEHAGYANGKPPLFKPPLMRKFRGESFTNQCPSGSISPVGRGSSTLPRNSRAETIGNRGAARSSSLDRLGSRRTNSTEGSYEHSKSGAGPHSRYAELLHTESTKPKVEASGYGMGRRVNANEAMDQDQGLPFRSSFEPETNGHLGEGERSRPPLRRGVGDRPRTGEPSNKALPWQPRSPVRAFPVPGAPEVRETDPLPRNGHHRAGLDTGEEDEVLGKRASRLPVDKSSDKPYFSRGRGSPHLNYRRTDDEKKGVDWTPERDAELKRRIARLLNREDNPESPDTNNIPKYGSRDRADDRRATRSDSPDRTAGGQSNGHPRWSKTDSKFGSGERRRVNDDSTHHRPPREERAQDTKFSYQRKPYHSLDNERDTEPIKRGQSSNGRRERNDYETEYNDADFDHQPRDNQYSSDFGRRSQFGSADKYKSTFEKNGYEQSTYEKSAHERENHERKGSHDSPVPPLDLDGLKKQEEVERYTLEGPVEAQ